MQSQNSTCFHAISLIIANSICQDHSCLVSGVLLITLFFLFPPAVYISGLLNLPKDHAVSQLLACLPLLRPGNDEAKAEYLRILPKILSHSVENGCHIEESRQLLSYSLIHPAMSSKDRSQLTLWLSHLEEGYTLQQQTQGSNKENIDNSRPFIPGGIIPDGPHPESWQSSSSNTRSRDSGIGIDAPETGVSQSLKICSSSMSQGVCSAPSPVGRAITSTSALNGPVLSEHLPLSATMSSPAAFTTQPPPKGR